MTASPNNSITDLPGVRVSHLTCHRDLPSPSGGKALIRTGLTAVFPYPPGKKIRLFAAAMALGGRGELTGYEVLDDFCYLNSPAVITNSFNVGRAYNAVLTYGFSVGRDELWPPVVIGVDDSYLSDSREFLMDESEILEAFREATEGQAEEGSVGVGYGLSAFGWKGGVGNSSRVLDISGLRFTCGVLAATNLAPGISIAETESKAGREDHPHGSLTIIGGTDLPVVPHQMQQVASSILLSLGALRSRGNHCDVLTCLLFSTANPMSMENEGPQVFNVEAVDDSFLSPISAEFEKAAWEAVARSLLKARPVRGKEGREPAAMAADDWERISGKRGRF
ncbi:MAG: P1 family peptidase [Acidobacteriota bacterium]